MELISQTGYAHVMYYGHAHNGDTTHKLPRLGCLIWITHHVSRITHYASRAHGDEIGDTGLLQSLEVPTSSSYCFDPRLCCHVYHETSSILFTLYVTLFVLHGPQHSQ